MRPQAPEVPQLASERRDSRWCDIWGWLGIVAGAAVLVTALVLPLDNAGLALAAALVLRGGRLLVVDRDA